MAYTTATRNPVRTYIYRIRNRAKREYAIRYYTYLRGFSQEPEPTDIGCMAAQSVRMHLHALVYERRASEALQS